MVVYRKKYIDEEFSDMLGFMGAALIVGPMVW